jgi:hypothetical protein
MRKPDQQSFATRKNAAYSDSCDASVMVQKVNVNAIGIILARYVGQRGQSLFCLHRKVILALTIKEPRDCCTSFHSDPAIDVESSMRMIVSY